MNRLLKELAEQAGYPDCMTYGQDKVLERFAELIVKECLAQARSVGDLRGATDDMIYGADIAALQITKHFGVEE